MLRDMKVENTVIEEGLVWGCRPKNVHFEPEGCEFMGKQVVKSIVAALRQ